MAQVKELIGHCWLVVARKHGAFLTVSRVTANQPKLSRGEKAIKVNLRLPDSLFTEPELSIDVSIPAGSVSAPTISADLMENITDTLNEQLGISATVQLLEQDES